VAVVNAPGGLPFLRDGLPHLGQTQGQR
jgi:hypothetical protein